jgi:hypothetical protein
MSDRTLICVQGWGTSPVWIASSGGGTDVRHAEVNAAASGGKQHRQLSQGVRNAMTKAFNR